MKYTKDNIIGVEFTNCGCNYRIINNTKGPGPNIINIDTTNVLRSFSTNEIVSELNKGVSWRVTNKPKQPLYDIY